jgi:fatty acid desaturase
MAAGATHGLTFRLPARRAEAAPARPDRAFEIWRTSIWTAAAVGTAALVTTALNVVPGPADEIVMASAYTLTGILGHVAPLSE